MLSTMLTMHLVGRSCSPAVKSISFWVGIRTAASFSSDLKLSSKTRETLFEYVDKNRDLTTLGFINKLSSWLRTI